MSETRFVMLGEPSPTCAKSLPTPVIPAATCKRAETDIGRQPGQGPLPPAVQSVVIARDDDPAGSPADQALWRGVVRRLGQGLKVAVTSRPNDIAPKDAPALKDLDDVWRYDPELASILLNGANLEHGRLGDAVDAAILDTASHFDAIELGRARKGSPGCWGSRSVRSTTSLMRSFGNGSRRARLGRKRKRGRSHGRRR